ncbi:hypothetical protein OH460_08455 [Vibrio sp. Makdt]|uniref:hypothetical protein n=1 Tax=Vibrio sp. Makdt TaxID=2998828 RepID=UPI0022CD74B5|nr:hypothetical protein [Vibrio sp. Makdt]MDA0152331.1 hypothetical protein [Vibrio sp. Makdt]
MKEVLFGSICCVFIYLLADAYFMASIDQQSQVADTIIDTIKGLTVPAVAVLTFWVFKLVRNTSFGKKLLDLD